MRHPITDDQIRNDYLRRMYASSRRHADHESPHCPRLACPDDLLRLGQLDPTVSVFLMHWRTGQITWESMLLSLCLHLTKANADLRGKLVEMMERQPIIVPTVPRPDQEAVP